jgi:hypothetical protein
MQTQTPKYQGEPSIEALATGLGTLGRYGDEYMVHAAHGETVVPAEILEANPELKNQLFQQMRMMGIKDPNRYVVGNALNSINPLTGQPEFFFKRVFRAIRKVVKKIAPIVVPIIGNMIAPGIGGPIASALMTKMQGGSWGDALKGAALSYGMSALGSGVKGIMAAGKGQAMSGFFSGLKSGAMAPFQAASNLFSSGANNPLAQGIFGPRGMNLAFQSTAPQVGTSFSDPNAGFLRRAFDVVTPSYDANLMSPSVQSAGQYNNVIGEKGTVYDNIGNKTGINPDSRVYNASITDTNAYPSAETTSGGFDNSSQRLGDVNKLGSEFSSSSTSGDIISNADGSMDIINKKVIDGDTSWLDRNLGEKGAQVVREQAGNLVVPAVTTAAAYFMADEEDVPEADDPRLKGQTNAQQQAWSNYNAQRGRADYATWSRSPEAKQLLLDAGIFPSTQSASQIASSAGITQEQAQNYLNNQYAPFVNPLPTQPLDTSSAGMQIYNKGGIASFRTGGIQDLMTDATGNSLEQKNEEILLTGNPGDTFIHEGVTYKAGRPPVMVSDSETMMTNTATTPGSNFIGSVQPQTASGIFGGSGVATPDPNYTPSPNDFKSPLLQRLAQEAFKTPQTTAPYQQLNIAPAPDIAGSGIFMQNPNQQLYAKNVGPQLGGPVNQQQPMILAAGGGEIKGPGTGTSDSIPANLSDGEFVMTAEAVRNAGGGDRKLGAARMYDLMSRFEGGRA